MLLLKFQMKELQENEIMSLDKIIDQKRGEKVWNKGKCVKIPLLKNENGSLPHTLVFSQVF